MTFDLTDDDRARSSGDQGLRITDEMVERAAREQWELSGPDADHEVAPKVDHPGAWEQAGNGAWFLYRGNARRVLEAALTDPTDNQQ